MDLDTIISGAGAVAGVGMISLIYLIPLIIIFVVMLVVLGGVYALYAIAFSKTAKKLNYEKKYLAFIPFAQTYTCLYMLMEFPGRTDFSITPSIDEKIKIKDRKTSFLIALLVPLGISLVAGIIGFILGATLIFSFLAPLVTVAASVGTALVVGAANFVYMRDFLDMYEADKSKTTALAIVSIFFAAAIPIILLVYLNKEPVYVAPDDYQYEPQNEQTYY